MNRRELITNGLAAGGIGLLAPDVAQPQTTQPDENTKKLQKKLANYSLALQGFVSRKCWPVRSHISPYFDLVYLCFVQRTNPLVITTQPVDTNEGMQVPQLLRTLGAVYPMNEWLQINRNRCNEATGNKAAMLVNLRVGVLERWRVRDSKTRRGWLEYVQIQRDKQ